MGIVPVAPRISRLLELGDRKLSGLRERPVDPGLMRSDRIYMTALIAIMHVRIRSPEKMPPASKTPFQPEPGLCKPQ